MSSLIVIVDYEMGNLNSIKKNFTRLGINSVISAAPSDILRAEKIVLPGVGHFRKAMENLRTLGILDALNECALVRRTPVLGICLGMQLMTNRSEEGGVAGLSWFDADVVRFQVSDKLRFKVPHAGWNQSRHTKPSALHKGIPDLSEFYFLHSYHLRTKIDSDVLSETEYEYTFPSAIEKGNLFGVQYHPEKSHDFGELLLKNFAEI